MKTHFKRLLNIFSCEKELQNCKKPTLLLKMKSVAGLSSFLRKEVNLLCAKYTALKAAVQRCFQEKVF